MESAIRILSGVQPWWWIVLNLGKDIENRSKPMLGLDFQGEVLLLASKSKGRVADKKNWMAAHGFVSARFGHEVASRIPSVGHLPMGGIVGRASVTGIIRPMAAHAQALAEYHGADRRWHMCEQFGYLLKDPRSTPFVAWAGSQSAVAAPAALLSVLEQLGEDPLS